MSIALKPTELALTPDSEPYCNDVIDLKEYLMAFWAYKIPILLMTVFGILMGGIYIQNTAKIYTSNAIFRFQSGWCKICGRVRFREYLISQTGYEGTQSYF